MGGEKTSIIKSLSFYLFKVKHHTNYVFDFEAVAPYTGKSPGYNHLYLSIIIPSEQ